MTEPKASHPSNALTRTDSQQALARKIQSDAFVLDAHSDIPLLDVYPRRLQGERGVMKRIQLPKHRKGGVHGAIVTVHNDWARWSTHYDGAAVQTLEVIDFMAREEEESDGGFVISETGTQMEEARKKGKFSVLMSLEGAKAIEGSLEVLRCQALGERLVDVPRAPTRVPSDPGRLPENDGRCAASGAPSA